MSQIYFRLIKRKKKTVLAATCKLYLIGHIIVTGPFPRKHYTTQRHLQKYWASGWKHLTVEYKIVLLQVDYLCQAGAGVLKQLESVNQRKSLVETWHRFITIGINIYCIPELCNRQAKTSSTSILAGIRWKVCACYVAGQSLYLVTTSATFDFFKQRMRSTDLKRDGHWHD